MARPSSRRSGGCRDSCFFGKTCEACFLCQQAGEKALKSVWFFFGLEPWGHSLTYLIEDMEHQSAREMLASLAEVAATLDKLYIPTRYPHSLPDMMPRDAYRDKDSAGAMAAAAQVVKTAKTICRF